MEEVNQKIDKIKSDLVAMATSKMNDSNVSINEKYNYIVACCKLNEYYEEILWDEYDADHHSKIISSDFDFGYDKKEFEILKKMVGYLS